MLIKGTILGDRYEIVEKIGAGGMSIVYKATCNKLKRFVAVKVLREEFAKDESFVAKFKVEALSAASLSHPNIVGIYDVGFDQGCHYIVMEYVDGKTLKEVIQKDGPLPQKTVLEYGIQILSALRHAHRKQIIHRDIKPQNILVTHDNILKVTDFGIARAVDSSTIVATGNAIGSVHYFSPEQAKGKYVNETSDLYSCGIVLFELVTKRLPFEADSHVSIALKHINEEIPKPSEINSNISKGLEQIILKATDKRQELRYQNADEMIKDMKEVMANPAYTISSPDEMLEDHTILLSPMETEQIRQNIKEPVPPVINTYEEEEDPMNEEEEGEEDEEGVSTTYKILVSVGGVLATLLLVGMISVGVFFFMPNMTVAKIVVVPDFVGKTEQQAQALAKEQSLELVIVGKEATDKVDPGLVARQNPLKEQKVNKNSKVEIYIATEKQEVAEEGKVPDVLGMDVGKAQLLLEEAGFSYKVEREFDDTVENGKVLKQSPEGNTMFTKGEKVILSMSQGPEMVMVNVPELFNKTQSEAKLALRNAELALGDVSEDFSETVEQGLVIRQSVPAKKQLERGSTVDIVISKGKPEPTPVPTPTAPPVETPAPPSTGATETTKTHIIQLPEELTADSYHVVVMYSNNEGTSVPYDATVKKEQFPLPIQITGKGSGRLQILFDGVMKYDDTIDFNEVTE